MGYTEGSGPIEEPEKQDTLLDFILEPDDTEYFAKGIEASKVPNYFETIRDYLDQ